MITVEAGQRGEMLLQFVAGAGEFSQQLHFFLDANGALHERTLLVSGEASPAPETIDP